MIYQGYGNYCGPWWSDGEVQSSVVGSRLPIDALDAECQKHDAEYATGGDLLTADFNFAKKTISMGPRGFLFGGIVGLQYAGREVKNKLSNSFHSINNIMGSSKPVVNNNKNQTQKGASFKAPKKRNAQSRERSQMAREDRDIGGMQVSAPSAISSVLTSIPTRTKSIPNGTTVSGREFISTVEGNGVTTFGVGKSALLAPGYFYGGVLGQMSRAYQFYRWTKLIVHYIPKVSTSTAGQVVICSQDNITEPFLCPEATTMLQRAMVSGNGVMTPVWMPIRMVIQTDSTKRYIDATTNADVNSNVFAELQVMSQSSVGGNLGYLWLEYSIELTHPMLQPHLTTLPFATGPGQRAVFLDSSSVAVATSPVSLSDVGGVLVAQPNGTVYRAVLDLQASTPGTGATFATAWDVTTLRRANASSFSSVTAILNIVGGTTIYLAVYGSTVTLHTSLESAIGGLSSGQVVYRSATTTAGTWVFDVATVRTGNVQLTTVQ